MRLKLRADFEEAILEIPATLVEFAKDAVELAAQNYRLGIISDTGYSPGRALRELLRREGILHYFDVLAFSDEIGVAKPCPDAFRLVEGRLNFKSSEMLHIGDTEGRDIIGARSAGWQSALFIGVSDKYLDGTSAQYVFRDWKHFTEWL
jgi:putative hydrolase of the HAD superfamily